MRDAVSIPARARERDAWPNERARRRYFSFRAGLPLRLARPADVPPVSDELICVNHERGFALCSMRTRNVAAITCNAMLQSTRRSGA